MNRTKEPKGKNGNGKKKSNAGRPTKYTPHMAKRAYELALLGLPDEKIAFHLEIAPATYYDWKENKPEFSESIKKGKVEADNHVVNAMYQAACGYSHEDVDIRVVDKEIVVTPITKHYPPNPTSAIFWLKNRHPELWRDRKEHELSGPGGEPIKVVGVGYPQIEEEDNED